MSVAGTRKPRSLSRRTAGALAVFAVATVAVVGLAGRAEAAIVPTVNLATAGEYAVLGASGVTNTGPSTLGGNSLGISPGPASITGFPPGLVPAPGTTHENDAPAAQAQAHLSTAYTNAANRPVDGALPGGLLGNQILQGGVYAEPSGGALDLTGTLTLDGAGNANTVFIFQTDSALTTATGSTVLLQNGAQECNVFWQIGSSATLNGGSVFTGNLMAYTSISVNNAVTIHGRTLALNGAVTLINDTFVNPTCDTSGGGTTTTTADEGGGGTTTTTADEGGGGGTSTTLAALTTSTVDQALILVPEAPEGPGGPGTPGSPGTPATPGTPSSGLTGSLPQTGSNSLRLALLGGGLLVLGGIAAAAGRRTRFSRH